MLPSRRQLHALSRDPSTLRRAVLLTAAVFLLSAVWIGFTRPAGPDTKFPADFRTREIRQVLETPSVDRPALLRALREHAYAEARRQNTGGGETVDELFIPSPGIAPLLASSALSLEEQKTFLAWHDAMAAGKTTPELIASTAALAMPSAPTLPRTMAADLKRLVRDYQGALADYESLGALPDGDEARRQAVALAVNRDWPEVLARLLARPDYYQSVHAVRDDLSSRIAQEQLDVPMLFRRHFDFSLTLLGKTDYLLLSLLAAAVWFVSLHKACRLPARQWWFSLAAVPLGVFSTVITLMLLSLQRARGGLTDAAEAGPALLYQIASVGLREEAAKLICFLPLALLLLRQGTPARALMAASSVGLGFALKENIGYYAGYGGGAVVSRFFTATFLHIGMTGLCGLALFKFLRYPKNFGPLFCATFTGMVLLHGFYNFSQGGHNNPFSRELSGLFPFFIAGLAWYYFQAVRHEQDDAPHLLSAEAFFLLGTTIVMGTLLNFLVWESGWSSALLTFFPAALSSVLFGWLFHHFLRNA